MKQINFENLPAAVSILLDKVTSIETLLLSNEKGGQPEATDQLLTVHQAAEFLSLATPTVYGLVSTRQIPHSKKGKRLYFSKSELTAWVHSGRQKTVGEIKKEVQHG